MNTKKWKKLAPIKKGELHIGCLNCSTAEYEASMDKIIANVFGTASLLCDGREVVAGENYSRKHNDEFFTFANAEKLAAKDPNHDWQVVMYGPLHGETYQRHGKEKWVCVESNMGFV